MTDSQAELLKALHDEHAAALWRYVVRLTGDEQFAQDVVQETLLRAWKRPDVLDQPGSHSRAWLYTVARNLVIDDRRSSRWRREYGTDDVPETAAGGSEGDRTDAVLDSWLVTEALSELTEDHRTVIVLAYYGGKSIADMAAQLELPPGTVKSRLHYGLRALRLALQERGVTNP